MSKIVPFTRRGESVVRMDAMVNPSTGFNTSRDHGQQFRWSIGGNRLSKQQRDDLYARHELAWKIINLLPDNALRKGVSFNKLEEADQKKLRKLIRDTGLMPALKHGFRMSRLGNGAVVVPDLDDGQAEDMPLNLANLRSIGVFKVYETDYLYPDPDQVDRSLSYTHYVMQNTSGAELRRIHVSRLIEIPGCPCSDDWRAQHGGLWPSLLERIFEPLVAYGAAHGVVPNILKDIVRDVIKLAAFSPDPAACEEDIARERAEYHAWLEAMMQLESLINKTVLDVGDEFIRTTTSTAGIPETIGTTERRLVAASGYPHTVVLGEKPGGALGNSGTSQKDDFNELTENYQSDEINPALDTFFRWAEVLLSIEEIEYSHNPLSALSAKERAEITKLMSEAMATAVGSGMISEAEGATIYQGTETGTSPILDLDTRQAMEAASAERLEKLLDVPEPPPALTGNQPPSEDTDHAERERPQADRE